MNASRQLLLGVGVFFGGAVLLYAMLQQIDAPEQSKIDNMAPLALQNSQSNAETTAAAQKPLTADIDTETRILAEKRRERELRVTQLDQRAKTFLEEQERAELLAMEKARLENQKYRNNSAEPVMDEQVLEAIRPDQPSAGAGSAQTGAIVTKPVVVARPTEPQPNPKPDSQISPKPDSTAAQLAQAAAKPATAKPSSTAVNKSDSAKTSSTTNKPAATTPVKPKVRQQAQQYTVQRGDGLIKLSRRYSVPLDAILQANGFTRSTSLVVGQKVIIPSSKEVEQLQRTAQQSAAAPRVNKTDSKANNPVDAKADAKPAKAAATKPAQDGKAPAQPTAYTVARGDGLIKLARQYNVPVEALAQANAIHPNTSLRVGQTLTIPSRAQVARLQREAAQKEQAAAAKREAQVRLREARRKASSDGVEDTFGVQVALADNQQKADEVVQRMRAAGYPASTSQTSRGVRVIVGPEKGKEAALALKDKVNADANVDVNGAWVLDWR